MLSGFEFVFLAFPSNSFLLFRVDTVREFDSSRAFALPLCGHPKCRGLSGSAGPVCAMIML